MTAIKPEHRRPVIEGMAHFIEEGSQNPLVNFEIQRRASNVPAGLLELFYLEPDAIKIRDWHIRSPHERLGWVSSLLRYRIPRAYVGLCRGNPLTEIGPGAGWAIELGTPEVILVIDNPLPRPSKKSTNHWMYMDDLCLLIGVAFYASVIQHGAEAIFEDPGALYVSTT